MVLRSMMRTLTVAALAGGLAMVAHAATPSPEQVVERALTAAGGAANFARQAHLTVQVQRKEVTAKGEQHGESFGALLGTDDLRRVRMQLTPEITLVATPDAAWATIRGQVDERPGTPDMARGTINEWLFPLMVPYSLQLPGVAVSGVGPATFQGTPAWRATVRFPPKFFSTPVLQTDWALFVARDGGQVLGLEIVPPEEFRQVQDEGMRYRFLSWAKLAGSSLPQRVLIEGIDLASGDATAHFAQVELAFKAAAPNPGDFIHPATLEAIEEGGPLGGH